MLGNPAADQALGPFLNPVEQALPDSACVVYRVCNPMVPGDYPVLFETVFWLNLLSVTLIQIALGADNLIIITILANKLPENQRKSAVRWGLILAMLFRIILLSMVSLVLRYATGVFYHFNHENFLGFSLEGALSGKAVILMIGGLFLIWKGVKELRHKSKGIEEEVKSAARFG
ncbi:MAG: hypothetical protein P8Y58_08165, partial [Novosphingobium sp.]